MKKTIIISVIFIIISVHLAGSAAFGQADPNTSELVITITGFENENGVAKIAIVNSKKNYDQAIPFKGFSAKIINHKATQALMLPYGEYAIKVYHDENANNELDTTFFGIPKEKYGFSNNARGKFGPPKYEEAVFKIDCSQTSMTIEIQ